MCLLIVISVLLSFSFTFDYEEQDEYEFSLVVSDNGRNPRHSTPSTVTISITNLNDEEPVFEESTYSESCDMCSVHMIVM